MKEARVILADVSGSKLLHDAGERHSDPVPVGGHWKRLTKRWGGIRSGIRVQHAENRYSTRRFSPKCTL